MRNLFLTVALAMPVSLLAEVAADTTVVYNGKQIVISGDSLETRISVFTQDSTQMVKASETKFVNKQEIERIYVSSPFLPTSTSQLYSSMYPTIWWGTTSLSTNIGSRESNTSKGGLHTRSGFEIGFTTAESIYPINKRGDLVFSNAIQIIYSRHNFQNSALLTGDCHSLGFEDRTHAPASANYMSYASMRMPFMLGYAPTANWLTDWLDTQFGLALVPEYRFGKASYVFEPEAFGDPVEQKMRILHWGLNVDLNMVLGPVKFGATVGLLPVFKTSEGKKAYCSSLSIGINIGELFGKLSQNGAF
ncbi:MAG: hypothetical protein IJT98_09960 [Prevotella sp.]|nr:hypothetical protein [Prevotella sp.]